VTTLHDRLDLKDLPEVYSRWHDYPLVSIPDDQRKPLASANWLATIHATARRRAGATARRHHPSPAEAHRRWRGERSKPVRLGVRDHHTRFLCAESPAQTAQWCCWFCRRRIIFGPTCARGLGMLAVGPELRITGAAAQPRMVSVARIRLVSRKSTRLFKGIICDDISEFESHMPSHAVGSPRRSQGRRTPTSGHRAYSDAVSQHERRRDALARQSHCWSTASAGGLPISRHSSGSRPIEAVPAKARRRFSTSWRRTKEKWKGSSGR